MERFTLIFLMYITSSSSIYIGFGQCLPFQECPQLKNDLNESGITRAMVDNLRSRLCRVTTGGYMLCCKIEVIPPVLEIGRRKRTVEVPALGSQSLTTLNPKLDGNRDLNFHSNVAEQCGRTLIGKGNVRHPWLVSIGTLIPPNFFHQCEAMLITTRHMIAAARCFFRNNRRIQTTHASFGEKSLLVDNEGYEMIRKKVKRVLLHPQYILHERPHNIALIEIEGSVDFNANIRPICMPLPSNFNEIFGHFEMTTIGWGANYFHGFLLDLPINGGLSITSSSECNSFNNNITLAEPGNVCAVTKVQNPVCPNESGSFMTFNDSGTEYLAGIMTAATNCFAFPKSLAIYTSVPYYVQWLVNNYQ